MNTTKQLTKEEILEKVWREKTGKWFINSTANKYKDVFLAAMEEYLSQSTGIHNQMRWVFPKLAPEDTPLREDQLDFIRCNYEPAVFESTGTKKGWFYAYRDEKWINQHSEIYPDKEAALKNYFKHLNFPNPFDESPVKPETVNESLVEALRLYIEIYDKAETDLHFYDLLMDSGFTEKARAALSSHTTPKPLISDEEIEKMAEEVFPFDDYISNPECNYKHIISRMVEMYKADLNNKQ